MRTLLATILIAGSLQGCATPYADPNNRCGLIGQSAGCVPGQSDSDTLMIASERLAAAPMCTTAESCQLAWSAARKWVLDNSDYKLQQNSADYMETFSNTGSPRLISVRVTKEPDGHGAYRIIARVWCATDYGCRSSPRQLLQDFDRTVATAMQR